MMISRPDTAYVWIWLPGQSDPVVAGRLDRSGDVVSFTYGRSYLARREAIPIWPDELPLEPGTVFPEVDEIASAIADGGPDAWGQRVINYKLQEQGVTEFDGHDPLVRLLLSGSDRVGALDFQESAEVYEPRGSASASLEEMATAAQRIEDGLSLTPQLEMALLHGSSVGGARPKALVNGEGRRYVAKFSSTADLYPIVKSEYMAMTLARLAGINAAPVRLDTVVGKDVLLVERFDRPGESARSLIVSALTILGGGAMASYRLSYPMLADKVRASFAAPLETLRDLFARMSFNVLVGNTDDHARNHAAIWDGVAPVLSPAYDICPQARTGGEASQAMAITREGARLSRLANCVEAARAFGLSEQDAREIIDAQIEVIETNWTAVCEEAGMTEAERSYFFKRQFLNPDVFYGY